jgi:uncharacterized membrane protein
MRYDEAFTYLTYVRRPFWFGISVYSAPNNHVLHTILEHFSMAVAGSSPMALRLPAFIAGILIVPITYYLARASFGGVAAALAGALAAVNGELILYSANARGYSMVCAFTLVELLAARELIERDSPFKWSLFVIAGTAAMWTIPIALFPTVAILVLLLISRAKRKLPFAPLAAACMAMALATILVYAPVMIVSGLRSLAGNQNVSPGRFSELIQQVPNSISMLYFEWTDSTPRFALVLILVGVIGFFINRRFQKYWIATAAAAGTIALIVLLQRRLPPERVWIFALPILLIFSAAGLGRCIHAIPDRFRTVASYSCVSLLLATAAPSLLFAPGPRYEENEGRLASVTANFLRANLKEQDLMTAQLPQDAPIQYYLLRSQIPLSAVAVRGAQAKRLFIIVGQPWSQSVRSVLEYNNLKASIADRARETGAVGYNKIYIVEQP